MIIIAHRGDSKKFGDNNMDSFGSARDLGVGCIEMDVCLTKDSVLIMGHAPVDKITGVPVYSRNFSEGDLKLDEVLSEFSGDKFEYIIDIKDTRVYSSICREIYELVRKHDCMDRCIIGSFNEFHLRDLKNIETVTGSVIRKAYITSNMQEDLLSSRISNLGITHVIGCKFILNQQFIDRCHSRGVVCFMYTCNTHGLKMYAGSLGVDGIITDVPDTLMNQKT